MLHKLQKPNKIDNLFERYYENRQLCNCVALNDATNFMDQNYYDYYIIIYVDWVRSLLW
jgi:hypothetical protein